jgi:two-component system cell cycle sensor histidine kinase/response regulator CckA
MPGADSIAETIFAGQPKAGASGTATRFRVVLLQTLVTIVLSYQLLFSRDSALPADERQFLVAGLLLAITVLMVLPVHVLERNWFAGALVMGDTALTTGIIYVSGNASSDLYVTYFLIVLIAAFTTSLKQLIGLSTILCLAYGGILYFELNQAGSVDESHLLRIPILLIMAAFYGVFAEMVRKERKQKAGLIDYIAVLKQAEEERERLIRELQDALANIKTLKGLLPICYSCKQIRDDKGYWNQIDTYVREHTEAEFTHGICPACAKKLYPDYYREEK